MKYFLNNDISYLIRKQYAILLCFLIAPIVLLLLRLRVEDNMSMILLEPIGGFLNFESFNIIMFIMYLFNVATLIYFGIVLYTRDLDDNLENIFLRMSSFSYIIKKGITFIGVIIILKVIQYSLMIGTLFLFSSSTFDSNVFLLLGVDIVYHIGGIIYGTVKAYCLSRGVNIVVNSCGDTNYIYAEISEALCP